MKYVRIPVEVQAIQVPVGIQVLQGDESVSLEAGDWLVFEPDGTVHAYDSKDFKQRFHPSETSEVMKVRRPRRKTVPVVVGEMEQV